MASKATATVGLWEEQAVVMQENPTEKGEKSCLVAKIMSMTYFPAR